MFVVWFGATPRLTVSDPALLREIFVLKSELFEKNESPPLLRKIEGDGLLSLKGEKWAHHRRIIQPTFHTENLKVINDKDFSSNSTIKSLIPIKWYYFFKIILILVVIFVIYLCLAFNLS